MSTQFTIDVLDDAALDQLVSTLSHPRPYGDLEEIEVAVKDAWLQAGAKDLDASGRVRFAEFFRRIGFLPKYKSYGVKYAAPFGYSLFDLENGGGFSIQLHETAKVEAFHVLATHPVSFILLCTLPEWEQLGETMVTNWKDGKPETSPLAYRPVAGDVAVIEDLSTVHTVTGCVVEEFATTSYDAVKRIYDQNEGRHVVLPPVHKPVAEVLQSASLFEPKRYVRRNAGEWNFDQATGGSSDITRLPEMGLIGRHLTLHAGNVVAETVDPTIVTTIVVLAGEVQVDVEGTNLTLHAGDTTALAPNTSYVISTSSEQAHLSICEVSFDFGFADLR